MNVGKQRAGMREREGVKAVAVRGGKNEKGHSKTLRSLSISKNTMSCGRSSSRHLSRIFSNSCSVTGLKVISSF